ncbi:MAG: TetR/AcrR family transcriptional regulator [Solirubrobacteraceae bacterium]
MTIRESTKSSSPTRGRAPGAVTGALEDGARTEGNAQNGTISPRRPRADGLRNRDRLLTAARDAFAQGGAETSLESIARRAGVGIGTLYRHFPNRQALLEAAYVGELEEFTAGVASFLELAPWDGFVALARGLLEHVAAKQALAQELFDYLDRESELFMRCRGSLFNASAPIVRRAQDAGVLREDTDTAEIAQLVGGIAKNQIVEPRQREHLLAITLDGLRQRG